MPSRTDSLAVALNERRNAFRAFLVARVGSEAEAEDILQNGLLRAVQHAGELEDNAKLTAWFYRVLRNAVVDHYRSRAANRRRDDAIGKMIASLGEDFAAAPAAWEKQVCLCLAHVVETLKPREAELLRRVDLKGESVQAAARELKLTPNHASVGLHRARRALRAKLEAFCGACASGACLDCDCVPVAKKRNRV